jgi:hypothetical protein
MACHADQTFGGPRDIGRPPAVGLSFLISLICSCRPSRNLGTTYDIFQLFQIVISKGALPTSVKLASHIHLFSRNWAISHSQWAVGKKAFHLS